MTCAEPPAGPRAEGLGRHMIFACVVSPSVTGRDRDCPRRALQYLRAGSASKAWPGWAARRLQRPQHVTAQIVTRVA